MANEIHFDYESGNTLYAIIRDGDGKVWNPSLQLFEDYGSESHNADDYAVGLSDFGGHRYATDFDPAVGRGRYTIQIFLQSGQVPTDTDELVGAGYILWTGSAELTCDKVLVNKAVQDKLTGSIDYYDDDGQAVILTIIPTDDESTITRAPQ